VGETPRAAFVVGKHRFRAAGRLMVVGGAVLGGRPTAVGAPHAATVVATRAAAMLTGNPRPAHGPRVFIFEAETPSWRPRFP